MRKFPMVFGILFADMTLQLNLINNFIKYMAFVEQVCDGYNKKALMGNWFEERLYPKQSFRENLGK